MTTDVLVIGAGPIGIEVAWALRAAGVDVTHVEAGSVGQTFCWWAPGTRFFSSNERIAVCGVPLASEDQAKATREQYLAYLRQVVVAGGLRVDTHEPVTSLRAAGDLSGGARFVAVTPRRRIEARHVVVATGGTAVPRELGIPGESLPHVSHYLADPHVYFGRRVLIVGGKNSAAEAAVRIHNVGAHVTLVHRGEGLDANIKYWLLPEIAGLIKSQRIAAHFSSRVTAIEPGVVRVASSAGAVRIDADAVLLLTGYLADMSLAREVGVTLGGADGDAPAFDAATMGTNVAGVFVAGTAIGGTQRSYKVFIENCHDHAAKIVAAITGRHAEATPARVWAAAES